MSALVVNKWERWEQEEDKKEDDNENYGEDEGKEMVSRREKAMKQL